MCDVPDKCTNGMISKRQTYDWNDGGSDSNVNVGSHKIHRSIKHTNSKR